MTEEFHPGFRNSTASYTVSLLNPKVIRDLRLAEHGLTIIARPLANFLPLPEGGYLKVGGGIAATQAEVAKHSPRDAQKLPEYYAMLDRVAGVLRELVLATPPSIGRGLGAMLDAWKVAKRFRGLDLAGQRDVLDLFTKSAGEVLDRWFESGPIKAAFGFDAVVGNYASPYTPGSAYVLLHHVFGEVNGQRGQWGHARGGMGAITQAMAAECAARGVALRTGAAVARVLIDGGKAAGVELADGEIVRARRVVANVNPKLLFQQLVAPEHLPSASCAHRRISLRIGHVPDECRAVELPDFAVLPGRTPRRTTEAALSSRRRSPTWSAPTSTPEPTAGRPRRSSSCCCPRSSTTASPRLECMSRASSASMCIPISRNCGPDGPGTTRATRSRT